MSWRATFKLKDILTDEDVEPTVAKEKAALAITRLNRSEAFTPTGKAAIVEMFKIATDTDSFNDAMDTLYDYADEERVWIA